MPDYDLVVGGGMTAAAAIGGINEVDDLGRRSINSGDHVERQSRGITRSVERCDYRCGGVHGQRRTSLNQLLDHQENDNMS